MNRRLLHLWSGILLLTGCLGLGSLKAQTSAPTSTIFDADPDHLWNRLYAALFLRIDAGRTVYEPDAGDVLFWNQTTHLVTEPSHGTAIHLLDEFIEQHGEKLIPAPAARALLQHDLWAAYDWVPQRDELLRGRLAAAIGRLAFSRRQIDALPDNYTVTAEAKAFPGVPDPARPEAPFLPPDLLAPGGPWVCLGIEGARPLAFQHFDGGQGRSAFFTFLRLPAGREATLAYLAQLKAVESTYILTPNARALLERSNIALTAKRNPETPQIPPGTMVALVRQMILIDDQKQLVSTHVTLSVQIRVYREIVEDVSEPGKKHAQDFHDFVLERPAFTAGRAQSLRARRPDEPVFAFGPQLTLSGQDPFDSPKPVAPFLIGTKHCVMCHNLPGIYSINSIANLFSQLSTKRLRTLQESTAESEKEKARLAKENFAKTELFLSR
jgi:hypothetical protein